MNGDQLRADDLVKSYGGRRVVDGLTLRVNPGEVVGLLGPNGAGKTTTFHMIVGFEQPDSGTISLSGSSLSGLPMHERARRGIVYLPQEPSVFRRLTVEQNILAILETLRLPAPERAERLERLLDDLGIAHLRRNSAAALSGGERRRLEIARALVLAPKFMLLDEPFAGIDPIAVLDIQAIISQLRERGIGILITDHNVRETLGICDRAYIVSAGRVIEEGPPEVIAASKRARQIYLGERFSL
ncbi:MAG: LPS export ABC transporter ATP-binding protein [Candidatus Dadabacteria bacterium]|nr:MAG: LPS export ABC transporter ATP-binding protein [Candidatus Dadabacteria bacterium]